MSAAGAIASGRRGVGRRSVLPGFDLALGYTLTYLGLIVLLPLAAVVLRASAIGPLGLWTLASDARVLAALRLTFGASLAAGLLDAILGLVIAWTLTRHRFAGRRLLDAAVDVPFALPTAVAGIALATIYAPNGWIGALLDPFGIQIAFTPLGVFLALVFVGLPFTVRTVQPSIAEIDREIEEAAATLGASRMRALLTVLLPPLVPAILTGFALALSRAIGEYGSVIFVAGNMPYVSEIAPLLVVIRLEEFDTAGATAVATVMLAISFAMLLLINVVGAWSRTRFGNG